MKINVDIQGVYIFIYITDTLMCTRLTKRPVLAADFIKAYASSWTGCSIEYTPAARKYLHGLI